LYVYRTSDNTWIDQTAGPWTAPYDWIKSFNTANGEIQIEYIAVYSPPFTNKVRIDFTDPLALNPALITVQAIFDVSITSRCDNNPFTIND